ncbi:hypothetical protein FRC07_012986 [Ceratobasidium sp. 392]|nr:hypothetical protein FRC07_012986 [Ceratobasidium sp. 392]
MPAADPDDQLAARTLEAELRDAVVRRERPQIELDWFVALPKRIRRSARLLEAAQAEAKVLLDHVRAAWDRLQRVEREREERLGQARTRPRDLECLRAPDPTAWNGLGRRKRRCRAFDAIGHAYTARQRASAPPSPPPVPFSTRPAAVSATPNPLLPAATAPVDLFTADPYVYTPAPLWQAAADLVRKVRGKEPFASPSLSELHSPDLKYVPPPVTPAPVPPRPPPRLLPIPYPTGPISAFDREVNSHLVWILARGRRRWNPGSTLSLQEAAHSVVAADNYAPGLLGRLCKLLFPGGVRSHDQAVDPIGLEVILDLCAGWYEVIGG